MPNHTSNVLELLDKSLNLSEVLKPYTTLDEGDDMNRIDFDKISPTPEELKNLDAPETIKTQEEIDAAWKKYNDNLEKLSLHEKNRGRPFGLGMTQEKSDELISKYGYNNWYDWNVANWGTKWNAYDTYGFDETATSFNTAWSPPIKVIQKLADLTGHAFVLTYLGEGGEYIGRATCSPNKKVNDDYHDDIECAPDELKEFMGYEEYVDEED